MPGNQPAPQATRLAMLIVLAAAGRSTAAAQQKVPLVLNHLALWVDSATYHDLTLSPFIRDQFAAADSGTSTVAGTSGLTLWGKYNFLQFAPLPHAPGEAGANDDVRIVFGVESPGAANRLAKEWGYIALLGHSVGGTAQYDENGATVITAPHAAFWVIQYGWGALRIAAPDSLPADDLATSRFLAHKYDPRKLLTRVTAATLAIPVETIRAIVTALETNGTPVTREGEGAIISLDGVTLHLVPSFIGAGVKQLQFALTRTMVGNPIYQFGPKSQLRFGPGPIAVWNFTWP